MMPKRSELKAVAVKIGPMVAFAILITLAVFMHPEPPGWLIYLVGMGVGGVVWQVYVGSQHAIILGRAEAMLEAMKQATDELTGGAEFVKEGGEMVLRQKDPNRLPVLEKRERSLH